ncbi:MAG: hypothetical protein CVU38_10340 [Chloroflexi bacterium HGW-Chloroflexi-1]|nr:MAG: hypothetical protein CVU38_10340 [Chloroflexi bacterium HGW-Chloroflexi-1]
MLTTIQGVYRSGRIELAEAPGNVHEATPVIVTFLVPASMNLRARGIDETQAADLRARLATFAEDWDSPEMDIYDDYDTAKARL